MPQLKNYTPFRNFRYYSLDNKRAEFGIVIVKATFELRDDGRLVRAEEQAPLVFTDLCHGAVNETSLKHPSDLVPYKPQGEVIVNAVAHAPPDETESSWLCGIRVEGEEHRIDKSLRVCGERWWIPEWERELEGEEIAGWREHRSLFKGWSLDEPEPAAEVPLRWDLAYGGLLHKGEDDEGAPIIETNEHNPLGTGWIDREETNHTRPVRAPSIEGPDRPVTDPYEELTPQNLGPIPPAWLPRRPLGGTYDQDWIDNVWPNWPADYDFAYHLSSPTDLRWPEFFSGRERITLRNLLPGGGEVQLRLPGQGIEARFVRPGGIRDSRHMNLDTIFLDIAAERKEDRRVYLLWRTRFEPEVFERVELGVVRAKESGVAMAEKISGRECDTNVVVSTGPDVCLTPVGGSMVPVAYTSAAFMGASTRVAPTVLDNESPDFHLNSRAVTSTGHEPGVGKGVVVSGYKGEAFITTASPTVFTETWATTRHRDPAAINRPGSGAVEPHMEPTGYYERILERVEGRPTDGPMSTPEGGIDWDVLNAQYAEAEVEEDMPARDLEPGTNRTVEEANGAAMLVTGAEAPPEQDCRRRDGESREEYFARIHPIVRARPRDEAAAAAQAAHLECITDGITTDPDYWAWDQNIDPEMYRDPTSVPGVKHNEVLSRVASRDPGATLGTLAYSDPWTFVGADGQVYSGDASSVVRESAGVRGVLAQIDDRYRWLRDVVGDPVSDTYQLSTARIARTARASAKKWGNFGALVGGSRTGTIDTPGIFQPSVPLP